MRKLLSLGASALALLLAGPALAQHTMQGQAAFDSTGTDSLLFLPALERRVMDQNRDVEAARHALDAARKMPGIEGGLENPEIELAIGPGAIGDPMFGTAYRVSAKQMIPLSRPGVTAARREAEAQFSDWISVRNEVLRTTRQAYYEYARASAERRVIGEMQQIVEETRRVALSRYAAGLVGEADALMAESEIASLDHEAIMVERERSVAAAQINALLGRGWSATLPPAPPTLNPAYQMPELQSLVELAWLTRPEIAAATARARASEARLRATTGVGVPQLGLMAAYDRFWIEKPLRPMVGVSLTLPLWFGRASAVAEASRATLAQGRAAEAGESNRVALQVQTAYWSLHESAHEESLARDVQIPVAQRALRAARAGYESSRNDFTALLNAERALTVARLTELRALGSYHVARAELEWAVGAALPWTEEGGGR